MKTIRKAKSLAKPTPSNPLYEEYITKEFIDTLCDALRKWENVDYKTNRYLNRRVC